MHRTRPVIYKVTASLLILIVFSFLIKNFWTIYYHLTPGSSSEITGKATCLSDISTMPDSPMDNLGILAIPQNKFTAWALSKSRRSGRLIFSKRELLNQLFTTTNSAGYYNLKLNPGNYSVCYAWIDEKSDEVGITGCVNATLGINKIEKVNINECIGTGIWCENKSACSNNNFSSVENSPSD